MRERIDRVDRRTFLKTTGAGAGIGLVAGCLSGDGDEEPSGDGDGGGAESGDEETSGDGGGDEPITIGGLQPYTGPFALYGNAHTAGLEYAVEEINEDGGVLGRPLEHEGVDTESDPGEAVSVYTRLVEQDDIVAAVGPVSSDAGVTVAQEAEQQEVPLYVHASGAIDVLSRDSRYTFRTALQPAPVFIEAVAEMIEERGYDPVGAINGDYAWGVSAEQAIERYFPDDITLEVAMAPFGESDFTPYLRDMPDGMELMVGSGHPPGLNDMFSQMIELGIEPELFTAAVSPPEAGYDAIGEDVARGFTFGHLPDVYSDEYREWAEGFYDATGEYPGPTQAIGYVTGHLIAAGLERAGEADPAALADAMREIEFDTLFAEPIQYTEWGELDQQTLIWSGYELEAPEYYPEGEFDLVEEYRTEPIDALDPDEW